MGDSGIGFEALSTGDCRLFRSSARNWPRRLLGFLQQYRSKADLTARDADFRFTLKADSERTSYHVRFVPILLQKSAAADGPVGHFGISGRL